MRAVYIFVLLFFSLLFELVLGSFAFPLFLSALVLYYISLSGPFRRALWLAILFGVLLDLIYDRALPITAVILTISLVVGKAMHVKTPTHPLETALPGMGVALSAILGNIVVGLTLANQPARSDDSFWQLIFFGALGLFIMPILTRMLDKFGKKLGLSGALGTPKSKFDRLRPRRVREMQEGVES
ncbi:MAG: hypothetical protein LBM70_04870 [Victivallales bacterium]|jgi:cell shape-determining protein MreD|nr:hypothetical protein [Victivallales bacterium]